MSAKKKGRDFLFGLGDEYCCDGGYASLSTPKNVFGSESECETAANALGVATTNCAQIGTSGKWRIDEGLLENMEDRTDSSEYQNSSDAAVSNQFANCLTGSCY